MFGYNKPWPKKENYAGFLEDIVSGFRAIGNDRNSLLLYGSTARQDSSFVPGRSDIDMVAIFDYDVVTDKDELLALSGIIANALSRNPVKVQISPVDTTTMRDGRFLSYDDSFDGYFKIEGKTLFGPHYSKDMIFTKERDGTTSSLAFNLRKIRQQLLMSRHNINSDYEIFVESFAKALSAIGDISKKIVFLSRGELMGPRFKSLDELAKMFPDVDMEPIYQIKHLSHNLDALSKMYKGPAEKMVNFWANALTCYESVLREYVHSTNKDL